MGAVVMVFTVVGLVVVAAALVVGGILLWARMASRRMFARQAREAVEYPAWAAARGLTYSEVDTTYASLEDMSGHVPFRGFARESGTFPRSRHVFSGTVNGRSSAFFQFAVSVNDPEAAPTHWYTVAVARLAEPVEEVFITPKPRFGPAASPPGGYRPTTLLGKDQRYVATRPAGAGTRPRLTAAQIEWLAALPARNLPTFHLKGYWATGHHYGLFLRDHGYALFNALNGLLDAGGEPAEERRPAE